ncbi:MAG TPA: PHP domain-containing protein [Dehalococcoidia bacterium]|nr:PHP domain-containing protein [Dehalococcoidia bacterium]
MPRLRADLHTHSHYSRDSVLSPEAYVQACIRKGITCAAVTDHNEIEGAIVIARLAEKMAPGKLKVITGEEIKTRDGEIIGLFLKELVPRGMSAEETVRAIKEQGGVATIPHPFDVFRRNVIKRDVLDRIVPLVDAVEGYNCRNILPQHDTRAREVAAAAGKPFSVGSDSHSRWEMGGVHMEMDDFETPEEFVQALARGRVSFRRSLPMVHWISTYAKARWRLGLRPSYPHSVPRGPGDGVRQEQAVQADATRDRGP